MGLDMFIYKDKPLPEHAAAKVDFEYTDAVGICYWRKHPNLHGFMQELYLAKGGVNPDFNGETVRLEIEDIDSLVRAVLEKSLPQTSGFFFGKSELSPQEIEEDLDHLATARKAIVDGYRVFYWASW